MQRRRAAAIRHVHHVDPGHHLEHLGGDVVGVAGAGRGVIDLARVGLGVGDELGNRLGRKRRRDEHARGARARGRDRHDVADEVEVQLVVERRIDGVAGVDQQQRVAIGRRRDDRLGAEIAAGAALVLDDEGLAEPLGQPLPDQAAGDVGGAARRERHHDAHRPGRIVERHGGARQRGQRQWRRWRKRGTGGEGSSSCCPGRCSWKSAARDSLSANRAAEQADARPAAMRRRARRCADRGERARACARKVQRPAAAQHRAPPTACRAVARRASNARGVRRSIADAEQREIAPEAVEQRTARAALVVEPQMRRAAARHARRTLALVLVGGRRRVGHHDRRVVVAGAQHDAEPVPVLRPHEMIFHHERRQRRLLPLRFARRRSPARSRR